MIRPVAAGDELELRVESLAFGARGVARRDGFVVFVDGGLPGDLVRARVDRVRRRHAEAHALAVLEPGPDRVAPPCAHYPECGGCRLQDLAYPAQAALKEAQVRDALARIAGIADPPLAPIVPAAAPFEYRNKLEYSFTDTPDGVAAGLHRAGRYDQVLPIARCWLTGALGNALRDAVVSWARGAGLRAYGQRERSGYLHHLVVREARTTGQALVLVVTSPGELPDRDGLVARLRAFDAVRSVHWAVNAGVAEVTDLPTTLLSGEPAIEERILGLSFLVGPTTFLQTNTVMAERLYALALEAASPRADDLAFDLYCGIGTISLALARRVRAVVGVDLSAGSVARARENAARNGLANATFVAGDVAARIDALAAVAGPPDLVVVDPPRAGLAPRALARLGAIGAPRLVYVSCNPTTLAGDAKLLLERHGYRLERATPLDLFPQTPHVETVAGFTQSR